MPVFSYDIDAKNGCSAHIINFFVDGLEVGAMDGLDVGAIDGLDVGAIDGLEVGGGDGVGVGWFGQWPNRPRSRDLDQRH